MIRVAHTDEEAAFDFWSYVDALPDQELEGHDCSRGSVEYVYRHPERRIEHILIDSATQNVYVVIVVDRVAGEVIGHHLLNLAKLYGLED